MSTNAAAGLSTGDVLLQKYEIEIPLGTGATGRSYTAREIGSGKRVVVKLLAGPAAPAELVARVMSRVQSIPSDDLIPVIAWGEHTGHVFVVMEHFEADSLRRLMDEYAGQRKAFTLQESAQIVVRVLEAVDAAARAGLVHRQIKPNNVLVSSRAVGPGQGKIVRTVKVTGLGIAELVDGQTLAQALADRPDSRYLAPELTSPNAGGTQQSDLYSAGVLFYELLTGMAPHGTYLSPSQVRDDLPERVDGIVDIALAANAEDRYPTVRDMINDIQRVFSEDAAQETGPTRKATFGVIGAAVGVIVLLGLALWVFNPDRGARRADDNLRAEVVAANPMPDADTVRQKLAGREEMVYVPAGTYIKGRMQAESKNASATEPVSAITPTGAYYIDRFEWPNQKGDFPIVKVTYAEAEASCASVGKRLCSADEWERACKGPENFIYGYGDAYDEARCGGDIPPDDNRDNRTDRASGAMESCKSAYGVYDLSGGPREWTSTADPVNTRFREVKGGKRGSPERGTRCAYSEGSNPGGADRAVSFRCCLGEGEVIPTAAANEGAAGAPPQ